MTVLSFITYIFLQKSYHIQNNRFLDLCQTVVYLVIQPVSEVYEAVQVLVCVQVELLIN